MGAADSFDMLSSGGGHTSVACGFVLLNTAVDVVTGRCLVISTPHLASVAPAVVVLPPSARLLLMLTMLLLLRMPNWLLPMLLLVLDSE